MQLLYFRHPGKAIMQLFYFRHPGKAIMQLLLKTYKISKVGIRFRIEIQGGLLIIILEGVIIDIKARYLMVSIQNNS